MLPKGLKPKPELDQSFMVDEDVLDQIVSMADLTRKDTVLEIGAGTGLLTKKLARKAGRVIAIEIDRDLKPHLEKSIKGAKNVRLVYGNALSLIRGMRFNKIVSNIPYMISEPLIRILVRKDFELAVITFPKAFASRLLADEKDRRYSKLSMTFQSFFIVEEALDIQRETFHPQPKVNSIALKLMKKDDDSLTCLLLRREKMKVKNAIREAICEKENITKKEARKTLNTLKISNIKDKKVSELSVSELKRLVEKAAGFRKVNK